MSLATDIDKQSTSSEKIKSSISSILESNQNEDQGFETENDITSTAVGVAETEERVAANNEDIKIAPEPSKVQTKNNNANNKMKAPVLSKETQHSLRIENSISFEEVRSNSQKSNDHQSQIEPEGTLTDLRKNASRIFGEGMLQKVMSGEGQDNRTNTVDFDKMNGEKNEDVDATARKLREPPESPAKFSSSEETTIEYSDEQENGAIDDNNNNKNESVQKVEGKVDVVEGRNDEMNIDREKIIKREPSGTSTVPIEINIDQGKETTKPYQEEEKTEERPINNIAEKTEGETSLEPRPISELNRCSHISTQRNLNVKTATATLNEFSPTDNDSADHTSFRHLTSNGQGNGIPLQHPERGIPHLPPLVVPMSGVPHAAMQGPDHSNGYHFPRSLSSVPNQVTPMPGGKRKIYLHLLQDMSSLIQPEKGGFLSFRGRKGILRSRMHSPISEIDANKVRDHWEDRGSLTVSWYEGTSSVELQEHVRNSVIRKLGINGRTKLLDFRVLDESTNPPEEIVLSPCIPNDSRLLLRFVIINEGDTTTPTYTGFSDYNNGPPDSPSAAPSPYPSNLDLNGLGLNANQLALLGTRLNGLQIPLSERVYPSNRINPQHNGKKSNISKSSEKKNSEDEDEDDGNSTDSNLEVASLHPKDPIQKSLREITGLLLAERNGGHQYPPRQENRQVIFVLANYFVLFLSLIAISAEIQARAPGWHAAMEQQLKNVHDCSKDKESLFQCVENGDMAGLVASVVLWISRSAATKRIFLLGFESPKRLWTAVYESLVTAVCWGFSYIFIRRGMNPDNNRNFLRRYWKDAVYGSLAGFNAAFMKQVLKNLIPQEVIEDALQERQLKIFSWLPTIG